MAIDVIFEKVAEILVEDEVQSLIRFISCNEKFRQVGYVYTPGIHFRNDLRTIFPPRNITIFRVVKAGDNKVVKCQIMLANGEIMKESFVIFMTKQKQYETIFQD